MKLTPYFSRVANSEWDDHLDEDRDPEMHEEMLSRDWPEVSKPWDGGELEWRAPSQWMGTLNWSRSVGGRDAGPEWTARATDVISYRIWAERKLNEDWRGDYYTYEFNAIMVVTPKPTRKSRGERRTEYLASTENLAEAQEICEKHFHENFG